ncbi:hypothetical protein G5C66_23780, partial [Nocardioides sp. KC13]
MSINIRTRRRADAPAGWQPIGLPKAAPAAPVALVRRETTPALRNTVHRTVRRLAAPAAALTASVAVVSVAAMAPSAQAHTSETLAASNDPQTPIDAQTISAPSTTADASATTSGPTSQVPEDKQPSDGRPESTGTTGAGSAVGGIGSSLPTSSAAGLPVAGGFIANAPELFETGLFGGETVQTSTDPNQSGGAHSSGDTSHEGGGDACDFFLQHMWKNEDGIPVIGTNSHFLTYHTDPSYKNLPLSLASGAIGNSQMPIIDIYGGPLGWIPIFNPSHVRGHGTDYVTLLTGCGGMGLPVNPKDGSVDLNKIPTPEKVTTFAGKIFPSVPSVSKITGPDYLYNTLQTKEIMSRIGPSSTMTPDEYLSFAGNNFDAFRLLWATALQQVSSGNPTAILDVLEVTNNLKTLESLGMPGLPGAGGLPLPGSEQPSGEQPSGEQPSGEEPAGEEPSSDNPLGGLLGGSNPLGGLTGGLPLPGSEQPSGEQPSGEQ